MTTRLRKISRPCLSMGIIAPLTVLLVSCSTVPITHRTQLNLIPEQTMLSMGLEEYDSFLRTHRQSRDPYERDLVQQVGYRIQQAVEGYFAAQNMSRELYGYEWEFALVESDEVNAWCLPGGKVAVYTGILPFAYDDAGLAVVIGHEVAHAVAKHGNERMSQVLLVEMGGRALSDALAREPEYTRERWLTVFGRGAEIGALLPYSRLQENEADYLGLIFMAMAGYDPHAALDFWQRMAQESGSGTPEFLSTHPADTTRLRKIQDAIPTAIQYYRAYP